MITILWILCIAATVLILIGFLSCRVLKTVRYTVTFDNLPDAWNGRRILLFADLHGASYGKDNQKLFDRIKNEDPDIVLVPGDLVTCYEKNIRKKKSAAQFIRRISENFPTYFSPGNHERKLLETYGSLGITYSELKKLMGEKIRILENQSTDVDGIRITGLDLPLTYYERFHAPELTTDAITERIGTKTDAFTVLLAHHPDYAPSYAAWGAELTLSGHNHGGIVRLPFLGGVISPRLKLFPKYDHGLFFEKDRCEVVTSGAGSHSVPIRLGNLPEIVIITLKKGQN